MRHSDVAQFVIGLRGKRFHPAAPDTDQIALIQRGTCTFAEKVANAEAAGYHAVVVFNEGQPGRDELALT